MAGCGANRMNADGFTWTVVRAVEVSGELVQARAEAAVKTRMMPSGRRRIDRLAQSMTPSNHVWPCGEVAGGSDASEGRRTDLAIVASVRNLESKFACSDHDAVEALALGMGADDHGFIGHTDYFYGAATGRLKLRVEKGRGALIAYQREDRGEARESNYLIFFTDAPDSLREVLDNALEVGPVLSKRRHLLLLKHTRIHLDEVKDLGRYVELETVLEDSDSWDPGQEHSEITSGLGLVGVERLASAYVDLLQPGEDPS